MTFVGLDLQKRYVTACALDGNGAVVGEMRQLATTVETVLDWLGALPQPVAVAMEATLYWEWLGARFQEAGHTAQVADAYQVKLIWQARSKTDINRCAEVGGIAAHQLAAEDLGTGSRHAPAPATASWASISAVGADAHQESHSRAPDGRESLLCAERPLWQGGSYVAPDGRPLAGVSRRSATAIAPARRANAGSLGDAVAGRLVTRALPVLLYGAMCVLASSGYPCRRTADGPGAYPSPCDGSDDSPELEDAAAA